MGGTPPRSPAPPTISAAARAFLETPFWGGQWERIGPDDSAGWQSAIAARTHLFAPFAAQVLRDTAAVVTKATIAGATVYVATPPDLPPGRQDHVHLFAHGGGWAFMGGEACAAHAALQASRLGIKTYAVDYRLAPQHRFPAALDDCVAVYRDLVAQHRADNIVLSGASAGGNLAAATVLRARDEGLPLPAALALMTPCSDGTLGSDSLATLDGLDPVLSPDAMADFWAAYAGGHDRKAPYLSPVFGDFSAGFPRTLLQSGTRDLLLSDTVRLHRAMCAAGVDAQLHVFEAMPHGGFGGTTPEDGQLAAQLRRFFAQSLPA